MDPARRHASARLLSGLYAGDGLFVMAGRSGMGKSTLLRHLSEQISNLDVVYPLTASHAYACRTATTLADVLGASDPRLRLGALGAAPLKIARQLQELVENARSPVLLLDDADLLADEVLESIVTLSSLQATDRSLLSVVFAGHPSLIGKLADIDGDRPAEADHVFNLEGLAEAEAVRLIRHRLRAAGCSEETFGSDAIARIIRHAAGVPSTLVLVCRRALQMAEQRGLRIVTGDLVVEAISEELPASGDTTRLPPAASSTPPGMFEPKPSSSPVPPRPAPVSLVLTSETLIERAQHAALRSGGATGFSQIDSPSAKPRSTDFGGKRSASDDPSVIREPHLSIPDVTLGRPVRPRSNERTTRHYAGKRRGRSRGSKLAGASAFLVLVVAGLVVLMGGTRELSESSSLTGTGALSTTPPHIEGDAGVALSPITGAADSQVSETSRQREVAAAHNAPSSPGSAPIPSNDFGPLPEPNASDATTGTVGGGNAPYTDESASAPPATPAPIEPGMPAAPTPASGQPTERQEVTPPAPSPAPSPRHGGGAQARAELREKAGAEPARPREPQTRPISPPAKGQPARSREIDTLLAEGDARLAEGDLDAARSAYEQAYDKGSRAAAIKMAHTFDPRNVPGRKKNASPAEAILWYQDAARKGDRGANEELDSLASWLENDAATGNQEARRVLDLWRTPAPPDEDTE